MYLRIPGWWVCPLLYPGGGYARCYTRVVGVYPMVYPCGGSVPYGIPGWYASLLYTGGMPPYCTPWYTLPIPPWVHLIPLMHPGPAHPAAHGVRVCREEALGSEKEVSPG